jgi:hypothetical protein
VKGKIQMKKLIAICAVAMILMISGAAQATVVYSTGFEPGEYVTGYNIGNLGGQDGWLKNGGGGGTERFTVQNAIYEGSQAVKATMPSGGGNNTDLRYFSSVLSVGATDIVTLSYDQYLPAAWFAPFSMGSRALTVNVRPFYDDPGWNDPYNNIVLSTWGQYSGGYMQRIGFGMDGNQLAVTFDQNVLADKWSNLRLVANNGTGSAEAFLNNVSLGTVTFTPGAITSFETIEIQAYSPNSAIAYVDNLSLSIVPEPATIGILGFGALSLIRRKK